MPDPVLVTGFEPFAGVDVNPSGEVARRLDGRRIAGSRLVGRVLPVAFSRAPTALDAALAEVGRPRLILSLGVHRGPAFRLETRARARFDSDKPDNDGVVGAAVDGPEVRTSPLDVTDACARALRSAAGAAEVITSDDAGGYLCERVYRAALDRGAALDVPALFLHVPPLASVALDAQERAVEGFLAALLTDHVGPRAGAR